MESVKNHGSRPPREQEYFEKEGQNRLRGGGISAMAVVVQIVPSDIHGP